MREITVGLIPAPELPEELAYDIVEELPAIFSEKINHKACWKIEIAVDPLTGAVENAKEVIDEAAQIKQRKNWDYALCLTDLPMYSDKDLMLAEVNFEQGVAQLSLPAFGSMPLRSRVRKSIVQLVGELYERRMESSNATTSANKEMVSANENVHQSGKKKGLIKRQFHFSPIRRVESAEKEEAPDLRFIITPRIHGKLRVLFGMTYANRPWKIIPSFKPIVAVAFATGAYGLIFPTLWEISHSFDILRLIGLMAAAILSIVVWIITAHNLWEKPTSKNNQSVRKLYNRVTVLTLIIAVIFYYVVLFILFLFTVLLFVPPDLFISLGGVKGSVSFGNYVDLAWLATSIATLAGSIGASLENDELVRNITYGYRQNRRYNEMNQEEAHT
ncbi:hypothetical protein [Lentibacillus daqui]|uniref:hypothetical protein n=1 Tax=Lentibacillus daqui TaxID=2911514 RepID=UPI0022B21B4F|nr:hypothetical protein [Lentibacillus daqui]